MVKMIAIDLDGTLLPDDEKILPFTLSVLEKCKDEGIKIVIATGRSKQEARKFIDLVKPDFSVLDDGATITNENNEIIFIYEKDGTPDKMPAIELIADDIGIPLSDIVSFGDSVNDIEMVKNCGTGIAMENGIGILKEYAKDICGSNNQNGVAKWLEKNVLETIALDEMILTGNV